MSNAGKSTLTLLQGVVIGAIVVELVHIVHNLVVTNQISVDTKKEVCKAVQEVEADRIGTAHPSTAYPAYRNCIYADYNATTPVFEEVRDAMLPFTLEHFGNPSSSHVFGASSKTAIDTARSHVLSLVDSTFAGGITRDIVFTSCGTESDNGAITIALHHFHSRPPEAKVGCSAGPPRVIASAIEHPGILKHLRFLESQGQVELLLLDVNSEGFVSLEQLRASLTPETALVTVMHSNNEVGVIQPLRALSDAVRAFNAATGADVLFHSDVAQSLGKVMVDVRRLGVDMCTVVGHKFGAPKGVGALYVDSARAPAVRTCPLTHGGGQEFGIRSGTESVLLIAGLGAASAVARRETRRTAVHALRCKLRFMRLLQEKMAERGLGAIRVRYNGPSECSSVAGVEGLLCDLVTALQRLDCSGEAADAEAFDDRISQLPNTVSVCFAGLKSHEILAQIQGAVACSAGSACHGTSAGVKISDVLSAMKVPVEDALGTLRLSFGRHSLLDDSDVIAATVVDAVAKLTGKP